MNKTFNFILNSLLKTTTELNLTEVSLEVENALKNTTSSEFSIDECKSHWNKIDEALQSNPDKEEQKTISKTVIEQTLLVMTQTFIENEKLKEELISELEAAKIVDVVHLTYCQYVVTVLYNSLFEDILEIFDMLEERFDNEV